MLFLASAGMSRALSGQPLPEVIALVAKLVGATAVLWGVLPPVSLVLGGAALYQVERSRPRLWGRSLAVGALVVATGELLVTWCFVYGCIAIVLFAE